MEKEESLWKDRRRRWSRESEWREGAVGVSGEAFAESTSVGEGKRRALDDERRGTGSLEEAIGCDGTIGDILRVRYLRLAITMPLSFSLSAERL